MSPGDTELEQNNSIKLLPLREMIINDKLETVKGNNETRFCRNNKMQQSSKNQKKKKALKNTTLQNFHETIALAVVLITHN